MSRQRHKYEYSVNPDTAAAKVVSLAGTDKRVLELGSGPGSITRLLRDNTCRVTALELDPEAIALVSSYCEAVHPCDLNDPLWPETLAGAPPFEVIVAADVLEHLYDPWATVRGLHPLLAEGGYLVVSLPHAGHNAVIACLMNGDFEYQPWGLLDRTHIRFFGVKNIQRLFNDAGFKIVEAHFVVKTPEQTEFAGPWRTLAPQTREALTANTYGTVYQVVVKAVPLSAAGHALKLTALPVPQPSVNAFSSGARGSRLVGYALSFLSLRTRQRLARLIERSGLRR